MLSVYLGDMPEAIYNTNVYFKNTYDETWINSENGKRLIQAIDGSSVLGGRAIDSPVLGIVSPLELSGGVKTLLLIDNCPEQVFNASTCGDNCAPFLLQIREQKDITINLRHLMNFGDGTFDIMILNTNSVVHNMKEFFDVASDYV